MNADGHGWQLRRETAVNHRGTEAQRELVSGVSGFPIPKHRKKRRSEEAGGERPVTGDAAKRSRGSSPGNFC